VSKLEVQDKDLLSPDVMQTRNYASNHSSRAVVPTTQICNAVCKYSTFCLHSCLMVGHVDVKRMLFFQHLLPQVPHF